MTFDQFITWFVSWLLFIIGIVIVVIIVETIIIAAAYGLGALIKFGVMVSASQLE